MWSGELRKVRDRYEALGRDFEQAAADGRKTRRLAARLWATLAREGLFTNCPWHGDQDGLGYAAAAIEGLTCGIRDSGTGISLIIHIGLGLPIIQRFARAEVRSRYIELLEGGETTCSLAMTEPSGGSEAFNLDTTVSPVEGGYRLNGEKWHITNMPVAGVIVTFARDTETNRPVALLVDPAWKGVERSAPFKPSGLRSSPLGGVHFREVFIPDSHLLGEVGDGIRIFNLAALRERIMIPFAAVGLLDRLIRDGFAYAQDRVVFNQPIAGNQYVRKRLTDMQIAAETTRGVAHMALRKHLAGEDASMEASVAKVHACQAGISSALHVMQIFGSHGYREGLFDDILLSGVGAAIGGGTEEMQREMIYQSMYLRYRRGKSPSGIAAGPPPRSD